MRYCPEVMERIWNLAILSAESSYDKKYLWERLVSTDQDNGDTVLTVTDLKHNVSADIPVPQDFVTRVLNSYPKLLEAQILWEMMDDGNKRRLLVP